MSNGFKRILLDLAGSPLHPTPSCTFINPKNVTELVLFEAGPSQRQQPVQWKAALVLRSWAFGMQEFQLKNDQL